MSAGRRALRAVTLAAALALAGVPGTPVPAATGVTATAPGLQAESFGHWRAACGPTGLVATSDGVLIAAGELVLMHPGGEGSTYGSGGVHPYGFAAIGDRVFATEPACNEAETSDPVNGSNCIVSEAGPQNGHRLARISTACGFGIAADPVTGDLTVGARSGGRVMDVPLSGGPKPDLITDLGPDPAIALAWSADGRTLYGTLRNGAGFAWDRATKSRRTLAGPMIAITASPAGFGLGPAAVTGGGPSSSAVRSVPPTGSAITLAAADQKVTALTTDHAAGRVYVALPDEIWLLTGRYQPPAPPPVIKPAPTPPAVRPVPAPTAAPRGAPPVVQTPSPPPAPPAPPTATAAQIAAQPGAVSNVALVPGDQELEGALRLAATAHHRGPPITVVWLALAAAVAVGGVSTGWRSRLAYATEESRCPSP
jgi:hypothetical protein